MQVKLYPEQQRCNRQKQKQSMRVSTVRRTDRRPTLPQHLIESIEAFFRNSFSSRSTLYVSAHMPVPKGSPVDWIPTVGVGVDQI